MKLMYLYGLFIGIVLVFERWPNDDEPIRKRKDVWEKKNAWCCLLSDYLTFLVYITMITSMNFITKLWIPSYTFIIVKNSLTSFVENVGKKKNFTCFVLKVSFSIGIKIISVFFGEKEYYFFFAP